MAYAGIQQQPTVLAVEGIFQHALLEPRQHPHAEAIGRWLADIMRHRVGLEAVDQKGDRPVGLVVGRVVIVRMSSGAPSNVAVRGERSFSSTVPAGWPAKRTVV